MSSGRMITKDVAFDRRLWEMISEKARWLFPFIIPHTDLEGRVDRDARALRLTAFPLLKITDEAMEIIVLEWIAAGLCVETEDKLTLSDFARCNRGLRSLVQRRWRSKSGLR